MQSAGLPVPVPPVVLGLISLVGIVTAWNVFQSPTRDWKCPLFGVASHDKLRLILLYFSLHLIYIDMFIALRDFICVKFLMRSSSATLPVWMNLECLNENEI